MSDDELTVEREDAEHRYVIRVGDTLGGYTEFRQDREGRLVLPHTLIIPSFRGRGLAGILVGRALADIAARGETVVPLCPVVVRYLQENEVPGLDIDWPDASAGGEGV
ncbi:GNAT family N-acetyltransferase [Microbacterium sp.]|uniref:GNAT family N-acetyltransferase n=1 Tax=Microbacterium sp. TaxID=51671 RepID=UPI00092642AA|nr:GNAT family N-acetyltransferase [Microbacterium sp.]OJU72229.1 MAG: GNAT family N-acetyltransferase [Microbacterium sp. 70-38]